MSWLICRTKFGPLDDKKKMFLLNEDQSWVTYEEATRFDSCKFLLPRGHGAVFISEEDARKVAEGKLRVRMKK